MNDKAIRADYDISLILYFWSSGEVIPTVVAPLLLNEYRENTVCSVRNVSVLLFVCVWGVSCVK